MDQISRIGMDTSKRIFQLHGVDQAEQPVLRKKLRRREMMAFFERLPPTQVAIEACGSAHHWGGGVKGSASEAGGMTPEGACSAPWATTSG